MNETDLKARTKRFALDTIEFWNKLGKDECSKILGRQLLRSATSVGANYRAACRAKSVLDFIAKLGIVLEEVDESAYWIELLLESGKTSLLTVGHLLKEADALSAIMIASIKTARSNLKSKI